MTKACPFAKMHSGAFMISGGLRRLILLIVFSGCLAGGLHVSFSWTRVVLFTVAACIGITVLVDFSTYVLYVLVDKQRWKYKLWDETGKTVLVPNSAIQGKDVKRLFGHRDLNGKSAGGLRKLIRWWHAPCSDCHQEIMEQNAQYLQMRPVTARMLSMPDEAVLQLVRTHLDEAILLQQHHDSAWAITKLRSIVAPISMSFCYEFVFGRRCPPEILPMLVASTGDVIAATGSMSRRNMSVRMEALAYVRSVLKEGRGRPDIFGDNCSLTLEQRAQYLQGVWIHTAVTQILRLTCNAICNLSRNQRCLEIVKREMGQENSPYADAVLLETLRLIPGITITNRIVSKDIVLSKEVNIPAGTNIVFDFASYQRMGFDKTDEFIPERWIDGRKKDANFMPFGVGKRRCPAEGFSMIIAKEIMFGMLASLDIHLPPGYGFLFSTRSRIANDLCCVVRRPSLGALRLWGIRCWLGAVLMVVNVRKSLIQLTFMPRNAKDAFHEHQYK